MVPPKSAIIYENQPHDVQAQLSCFAKVAGNSGRVDYVHLVGAVIFCGAMGGDAVFQAGRGNVVKLGVHSLEIAGSPLKPRQLAEGSNQIAIALPLHQSGTNPCQVSSSRS